MTGRPGGPLSNGSLKLIIGHSIQWPIRSNYIARAKMEAKRGSYTCNNVLNIILHHKEEAPSHAGPSQVHRSHFKIWNNDYVQNELALASVILHSRVSITILVDAFLWQLHFIFMHMIFTVTTKMCGVSVIRLYFGTRNLINMQSWHNLAT